MSDLNGTGRVKFIPLVGSDTEMKQGLQHQIFTRHQCITVMKEYKTSSQDNKGENRPIRARVSPKKFLKAKSSLVASKPTRLYES